MLYWSRITLLRAEGGHSLQPCQRQEQGNLQEYHHTLDPPANIITPVLACCSSFKREPCTARGCAFINAPSSIIHQHPILNFLLRAGSCPVTDSLSYASSLRQIDRCARSILTTKKSRDIGSSTGISIVLRRISYVLPPQLQLIRYSHVHRLLCHRYAVWLDIIALSILHVWN